MRFLASCVFSCLFLFTLTSSAQPGPSPAPPVVLTTGNWITVMNGSKVLFQVAGTALTMDKNKQFLIWDCADDPYQPTAVLFPFNGIAFSANYSSANCPQPPSTQPNRLFQWVVLSAPQHATDVALHVGEINGAAVDDATQPGSLLFYPQSNAPPVPSNAWASISFTPPLLYVRKEAFCAATVNCNPSPAPPSAKAKHDSISRQADPPALVTTAGTCKTTAAYGYPVLQEFTEIGHRRRYHAKLPLWPPIDNENECSVRQLVFNVPNDLVDGLAIGGEKSTIAKLRVYPNPKQSNGLPVPTNVMTVYGVSRGTNGPFTIYSFDSQATYSGGSVQTNGSYCVEITIEGKEQPLTSYGSTTPITLPTQPALPKDCQ